MSFAMLNEDVRSIKTKKSLYTAMFSLLKTQSFRKITIKGICEEALISRATFYAHFVDKYDLLKHWMTELWPHDFAPDDPYEQVEAIVNHYMRHNIPILKNLLVDADEEALDILHDFILSTIDLHVEKNTSGEFDQRTVVLSNFFAGGLASYILWQIKNKFPPDMPPMNRPLYDMIHDLQNWQSK